MVRFRVYDEVRGKPRPRVNRNGKVWTPEKFKDNEEKIAEAYIEAGGRKLEGPVCVSVRTFRALPKKRPKRILSEEDMFKPDIDNILKQVLDALNGVAYDDDKQVVRVLCCKMPRERHEEFLEVEVATTSDEGFGANL